LENHSPAEEDPTGAVAPETWFSKIAVPAPLGKSFTYSTRGFAPAPGSRVFVELGRRKCLGVVLESSTVPPPDVESERVKPILEVIDEEPSLPPDLLKFLVELAKYYLAPLGEVMRLALPVLAKEQADLLQTRHGKKLRASGKKRLVARWLKNSPPPPAKARPKTQELVTRLIELGEVALSSLERDFPGARAVVNRLAKQGFVELFESFHEQEDPFFEGPVARDTPKVLNADQTRALVELEQALLGGESRAFLLHGVTGSGKTEIYLRAADKAQKLGKSCILLVPEIALTPQLVARFRARLGDDIAVLHSELSPKQKLTMWRNIRSGKCRVVVGARSALFAPVADLGLICVDEEHDPSFKQEEGVRYHARDMALLRARRASAVCILGSATPSVTTFALVEGGRLQKLVLRERAHQSATLPEVRTIDLRRIGPGPSGDPLLSLELHRAIEENLESRGQTILFLNRRGFSPSVQCGACGTVRECPNCSVALTLHRADRERLLCHYCGYTERHSASCPICGGAVVLEGLGTEQVESLLAQHFPEARIARLDRDVAHGTKSAAILDRMRRNEVDILVGTQMVAKGHDLPGVTLVGVLNADAALSLPDFRAAERTFQLLVQVSGRAGRADRPGLVLIQSRMPDHPAIRAATHHDVETFVEAELEVRHETHFPPYSHLALVRLDGRNERDVRDEAARFLGLARQGADKTLEFLGPTPAPLVRLQNRYRYRFLIRASERPTLRQALLRALRVRPRSGVTLHVDVDPQSFF
jgi:primosomal protein N' (replication factor Y) (superfamily II helicase)